MSARDRLDERCPGGFVILWSQRAWPRTDDLVLVYYPCCGHVMERHLAGLDLYRKGRVRCCKRCARRPVPVQGPRPLCPGCSSNRVMQRKVRGVVVAYEDSCWSCRYYDPARRAARYHERGT